MKVALIQQQAQGIGEYDAVFANLLALTREAIKGGAELIVQPEAAYPAYFLGIDEAMRDKALARSGEYLETMSALAEEAGVHIVAGAAIREGDLIYNAGIMYDDVGNELGRAYKSNMWHFDAQWFTPGTEYKAFDTKFGRMGIMVCADGRVPEIARILSLDGAKVIIDLVNLTAAAAQPSALMNQQYAFILQVRAMENGSWLLVSDKAGLEAKTASYLGRSMAINPKGEIVADASPDKQEILYVDVDPDAAGNPMPRRRPELYGELVKETEHLPVFADLTSGISNIAEAETYVTAVQFAVENDQEYLEKAKFFCHAARFLGTHLLCLPPMASGEVRGLVAGLQPSLKMGLLVMAGGGLDGGNGAVIFDSEKIYGEFYQTHGDDSVAGKSIVVAATPIGKIAAIFGDEPYVPEVPRVIMLLGCDILVWLDSQPRPMNTKVLQTRAAENKIFMVRVNSRVDGDCANIANPDGAVVTSTFVGAEQGASATLFLPLAKAKSVVPFTSVVTRRLGPTYGALLD